MDPRAGWRELREIQVHAITEVYGGEHDLIVAASTVGGKTEAAFLPLISQVLEAPAEQARFDLLYIGSLKALITDQAGRLSDICRDSALPVVPYPVATSRQSPLGDPQAAVFLSQVEFDK